ncbi:MAG: hypothetical protein HUK26_01945 [Duodenibacillus sp.]|nr:hypothetical protein [Duodenibacillus sp.]
MPQPPIDVEQVMRRLSPQASAALRIMAASQERAPEDVLRDEIRAYIAGRMPAIDIDAAMAAVKDNARRAGWLIGRLRRLQRRFGEDD